MPDPESSSSGRLLGSSMPGASCIKLGNVFTHNMFGSDSISVKWEQKVLYQVLSVLTAASKSYGHQLLNQPPLWHNTGQFFSASILNDRGMLSLWCLLGEK